MRVDLYTKAVLTVIAVCLIYLSAQMRPQKVYAEATPGPTPVVIVGAKAAVPVVYAGVKTSEGVEWRPLPVGGAITSYGQEAVQVSNGRH